MRIKINILLLLIVSPLLANAQIIKTIILKNATIQVYRLDERQKNNLSKYYNTKYKKKDAQLTQEILNYYSKLELALDNRDIKEAREPFEMIDFRLGSDAPNIRYLRDEYNSILNENRIEEYQNLRTTRDSIYNSYRENQIETKHTDVDSLDYYLTLDTSVKFPHHNYGAKYIGNNFNRVASYLLNYIVQKMKYSQVVDTHDSKGNIVWKFVNNGINAKERNFTVVFYLENPYEGTKMNITKIEMFGSWDPIVYFFCHYWATSINFDDKSKGAIATSRFSSDYIKIISNYPKAKLEITNYK